MKPKGGREPKAGAGKYRGGGILAKGKEEGLAFGFGDLHRSYVALPQKLPA